MYWQNKMISTFCVLRPASLLGIPSDDLPQARNEVCLCPGSHIDDNVSLSTRISRGEDDLTTIKRQKVY